VLFLKWKLDREDGAAVARIISGKSATVLRNYAMGQGQANAVPF